jgi:hypothetical protein
MTGKDDSDPATGGRDTTARLARGPVAVATLVRRLTKPALGARGLAGADLLAHWPAIVGPELAALATPQALKRAHGGGSDGGTLALRVASPAAATVLQLKGPQIVERINRYFGYRAVARLQPVPGGSLAPRAAAVAVPQADPAEVAAVAETVAGIADPDLKAALIRLGAAVRRRARRHG